MQDRAQRCSRRKFLASTAALALAGVPGGDGTAAPRTRPERVQKDGRKPLAVLTTVYRPLSESYHLAGRFLHGYFRKGELHVPEHFVHSLYTDQRPENDLSREVQRDFDVRVTSSIEEALTQGGELAVEGILLIAEHGNYPRNNKRQTLYPRFEMMEQIVSAFRRTGQTAPVFCSNHLSYRFDHAKKMREWADELGFPLMAGSAVPVTWRRPELELPLDAPIEEALVAAHGPLEVGGFDALEALQCMMERRKGGETGVKAVTCLVGKDVWRAGDSGRWSWELLEAALSRSETLNPGDIRRNVGNVQLKGMPAIPPTAFLIDYLDGTRGTVLLLNGHIQDFCFAAKLEDEEKASCLFHLPQPPGARYFDALASNIEQMLTTAETPYPIDRTLLTTGILERIMESHSLRGKRIQTSHLEIGYAPPESSGFVQGSTSVG